MPGRVSIDELFRRLRQIRDEGDLTKIRDAVVKSFADHSNLIIAEAAKLIRDFELKGLEPVILATWKRLIEHPDPIKVDKGCTAKTAIIEVLGQSDFDDPDFYLSAIRYEQVEPAWGGDVDTAENVRGGAALALARSQRLRGVDKLNAFVDLLQGSRADRMNAARAIADTGHESAVPLLRLKLLSDHSDLDVMGACMSGLLELAPAASIPLIGGFLKHPTESIVLEAAAALGICGRPKAVELLIAAFGRTANKETMKSLMLSIGLSRDPTAIDFLIGQLETGDAAAAFQALQPSCVYPETQSRVRTVIDKLGDKKLREAFERKFERGS